MKTLKSSILGCAVALALLGTASTSQATVSDKSILVGVDGAFAPFTYIDDSGKLIGFDVDIINSIGKNLGYKVTIKPMPFDGIIPALMSDSIDVIISGFTISPERAKKVDFSDPYYLCGLTYLVPKADKDKYPDFTKLDGKDIGVQIGTTGALFAQKHLKNSKIKQFNSPPDTYMELGNGGCSAVINDMPVNDFFLTSHKDSGFVSLHIDRDVDKEYYGIAVSKNHPEMLKEMNRGLKLLHENGEFSRISDKWFGYDITDTLKE